MPSEDPASVMDPETHLPPAVDDDYPPPTVNSPPNSSPIRDASPHDIPGTSAWQSVQETTPTKPPSSASSSTPHTPDGDDDGQEEFGSPSSGCLPIITNVMSLNPSLWKSP